jgi:Ring finger domain
MVKTNLNKYDLDLTFDRKQLHYIYDTRPGAADHYLPYIQAFHDSINRLKAEFPMPVNQHIPTNKGNMFSCLSPVHPIASTKLPDWLTKYDDKCSICMELWEESPHTFVVELHCGHSAHYTCVREHWDNPDAITLRCPLCRSQNHPWGLHEIADLTPEVLDVWDYERVYPPQPNEGTRAAIVPGFYEEESQLWRASNAFTRERGYNDEGPIFEERQEREPYTEMVIMRHMRRTKNEYRRNLLKHLGETVWELDPTFERPPKPDSFLP